MATRISTGARDAAAAAIGALLNGGTVELRTGSQPATPGTAATGTLLATLSLSATAFGSPSTGTITANAITQDASADASGTAGWFRGLSSGGTAVIDGAVGTEMTLNNTSIVAGGTVSVSSWTITMPGA